MLTYGTVLDLFHEQYGLWKPLLKFLNLKSSYYFLWLVFLLLCNS